MKLIKIFLLIIFLSGCRTEKSADSGDNSNELKSDADKANNNFYDFFQHFIRDDNYRSSRVKNKEILNKIFFPENEYTVQIYPFDSIDFREFDQDLDNKKVYTILNALEDKVTNYNFIKENDKWFLASADSEELQISEDKKFLSFLLKFSKDTIYQKKHIRYPLKSSFLDNDNDYADTSVYLRPNEVYAKNFLADNYLAFFHNGEILKENYNNATVYFRGNGNGIYIECQFKFTNGQWFMVEEKDFST